MAGQQLLSKGDPIWEAKIRGLPVVTRGWFLLGGTSLWEVVAYRWAH